MKHKPFGELSRDEKIALMTAWVDGKQIEYDGVGRFAQGWVVCEHPSFNKDLRYRVKPDTPDFINWSHVSPEYKWMARDKDGAVWLFPHKPRVHNHSDTQDYWVPWGRLETRHDRCRDAAAFSSYKQGTVDWKDSLVERSNNL